MKKSYIVLVHDHFYSTLVTQQGTKHMAFFDSSADSALLYFCNYSSAAHEDPLPMGSLGLATFLMRVVLVLASMVSET